VVVRARREGDDAVVDVIDDGAGIAADMLAVIFEPFVQGQRSLDRSEGGLGIGLALVKSLVEMHGGGVRASSAGPGKGSRFEVRLPLHQARAVLDGDTRPRSLPRPAERRRRVLVVDDNADAAELLADLLRDAGHEVVVAHDAPGALAAADRFAPDVALLDIGLPVMDGYELARRLRGVRAPSPAFVALTGYGQEHDRQRSRDAGFAEHLVKPVDAAQLLAVIGRVAGPPA
jgi:CheY-like chemotaxis protein